MAEVRAPRPGAQAAADRRRLVRLPAPAGLRRVPRASPTRSARYLMVDMAHFAGLVAAGLHPSPVPARRRRHLAPRTRPSPVRAAASSWPTTPRSAKKINSAVFPGQQGGPLEHVIAGQGRGLQDRRAPRSSRSARSASSTVPGSSPSACSSADVAEARASRVLSGGTDVHLVLVDLRNSRARRPAGRGPPARRSASPSTATPCRSTPARRWSPPACASAPRPWPPAASAKPSLHRGRRHHRRRARAATASRTRLAASLRQPRRDARRRAPALPRPSPHRCEEA